MKIAVAMLIALASGCGWTERPLIIVFEGTPEKEGVLRELVYRFEQQSGIQAELRLQQEASGTKGGQSPLPEGDVLLAGARRLRAIAAQGGLREQALPAGVTFEAARSALTMGGKLYAQPWVGRLWLFAYHEKMLERAGIVAPPKTREELLSAIRKLAEKRLALQPLLWPWRGDRIIESFAVVLAAQDRRGPYPPPLRDAADEEVTTALQWMKATLAELRLTDPSSFSLNEEEVARNFYMGHKAFMANWHDFCEGGKRDQSYAASRHCRVMAVPGASAQQATALLEVRGAGILAASRRPEDAAKFVAFLMTPQAQEAYCPMLDCLPLARRFYADKELDPFFSQIGDYRGILEKARPWIAPGCAKEAALLLRPWLQGAVRRQEGSGAAPKGLAEEVRRALRSCPAAQDGEPKA